MEFIHTFDQSAYDKAKMKLEKMLETEMGRKFFIHLVRSFVHNKPIVVETDDTPIFRCDLTSKKIIVSRSANEFRAHFIAKYESFERAEEDTDEIFEMKKEAYRQALVSSNPYAINGDYAYGNVKTDKKLCEEAIKAIKDAYDSVKDTDTYGEDFKNALKPYERTKKSPTKKIDKKISEDQISKFNKRSEKKVSKPSQKLVEFEIPKDEKRVFNDFSALRELRVKMI